MWRAKATDCGENPEDTAGLSRGMGGGTQGRLTTEPERPSSAARKGEGVRYKAKPKTARAERESEQGVVPMTRRTAQPSAGKALNLNRAGQGGKYEGLTQKVLLPGVVKSRTVFPEIEDGKKARQLQRTLYITAKQNPERVFGRLFDRMTGSHVLYEAWKRVRANRGAAGVDGETIETVERQGIGPFLKRLQEDLVTGRYRAQAVRRKYIPKADGRKRPLGIPAVRDRVAQMAAKIVMEPIFEADCASRQTQCAQQEERPAEGKVTTLVAGAAERKETESLKPADKIRRGRTSESPGRSESERIGDPEIEQALEAEPTVCGRRQHASAQVTEASMYSSGAIATAREQERSGELGKSSPSRGEIRVSKVSPITGTTRKWTEDGRMEDGSVVVTKASNFAGTKGPCWHELFCQHGEAGTR
jgi:hypothetical protein